MEERGLLERTRVPEDRRVVLVRLTPDGSRVLDEQDALSDDLLRQVLGTLDANQLKVVAQATADMRAAAETTMGPLPDRHARSTSTPRSPGTMRAIDPVPTTTRRD